MFPGLLVGNCERWSSHIDFEMDSTNLEAKSTNENFLHEFRKQIGPTKTVQSGIYLWIKNLILEQIKKNNVSSWSKIPLGLCTREKTDSIRDISSQGRSRQNSDEQAFVRSSFLAKTRLLVLFNK